MKHTPGPWEVFSGYKIRKCQGDTCAVLAEVHPPYRHNVGIVRGECESEANARLMAAAPDMLIALHEAEGWLLGWASAEKELGYIQAVIRKAEGK